MTAPPRPSLDEARSRLRELGYLDAPVERLLFRTVFAGRGGAFLPAVVIGTLAAALSAVAAIAAGEPGVAGSPRTIAAVFLHVAAADLIPAAGIAFVLSRLAERSRRPGFAATMAGFGAALLVFVLWSVGTYGLARGLSAAALLWAIPVGLAALLLASAVRLAFIAHAYAHSGALPRRANRRVFLAAAALGLLVAILLFFSRREALAAAAPQPSPRSVPMIVAAVDGLDLDGSLRPQAALALLAGGRSGWWPAERLSPPEVWTTLATGVSSRRHGVRALSRVRPRGATRAVRPPWGTVWWLRRIEPALGLAVHAPVSSADRQALSFWEVAASAGLRSLSVGWWASGDWPGAVVVDNRAILGAASGGEEADRAALERFDRERSAGFSLATVYLPGCDIERDSPARRASAAGRIVDWLAPLVDRAAHGELVLVVVAADSHPAPGAVGRVIVFDGAEPPRTVQIRPVDVDPSILARLGVPRARDLEGVPVPALFAAGTVEAATVPTYGPRVAPAGTAAPESDREYLEKLRSLGYLK
ncbi:MAG TPA: hypothetical protein VH854_07900 [Thermoanaerobaculia bacterium]|nr:hypothetical protein [Thermoanaerobaculia bacterium]